MTNIVTFEQAKLKLNEFCQEVAENETEYIIKMEHGKDIVLISADELESLKETLYLLKSPNNSDKLLETLKRSDSTNLPSQSIDDFFRDIEIQESGSTSKYKAKESLSNRDSLLTIMDEISQEAMDKGLNSEILESLLEDE